ncbi:MAG: tetratricopeptide repeat protein [Bacteroidia bacterium]|nr:tetratricopeptide repeat protein [Bacteroidia bacterium]
MRPRLKIHFYFTLLTFILVFQKANALSLKDSTTVNTLNKTALDTVYTSTNAAKKIGFEALALAQKIGFIKGEAVAYSRIGISYDVESNFDSAIYYFNKALIISNKINYKMGKGSAMCNMGLAYLNKNDYPNALYYLQSAIKPLSEIRKHEYVGNCYNNIGLMYMEMDNYKKATEYYALAENEYTIANNEYMKANVIGNMSMVYSEMGYYDTSITLELKAISYYIKTNDYYNVSKSYNNIGIDYLHLKNFEKAAENFLISIEYSSKLNNYSGKADTYANLATAYSVMGQHELSEKYAKIALDMLPMIKSRKIKSDLFFLYGRMKMRQGDYKSAYKYLFDAKWLKDSFFKIETADIISKAEIRFGLERKQIENQRLLQTNKIQQLELKNRASEVVYRKRITNLIIIASILAIVLLFIFLKRRLQVQRLIAENRLKAEQQSQRVHISHELHDNVGAQLSYIVSNLDLLRNLHPDDKRLESVSDMSKQAIITLRETVWALNNETISLTDFADKFKQYTSKILSFNSDIICQFKESLSKDSLLQPIQALNLFRICQEAFSNSIHHSKAQLIHVEFANSESTFFEVKITDNGIGFDTEEAKNKGHYGLITMKSRAEELGANFSILSTKNEGTTIQFTL